MLKFLKGILGVLFFLAIVGLFSDPNDGTTNAAIPDQVKITDFDWYTGGFGSVMEANFTIKNNLSISVKDITIKCSHYSSSGTHIDSNNQTIYEIIKAGRSKSFKKINMGFIHSQAKKSSCSVVGMIKIG